MKEETGRKEKRRKVRRQDGETGVKNEREARRKEVAIRKDGKKRGDRKERGKRKEGK